MCGIVGLINAASYPLSNNERETFEQLLYADALRGFDSTGVFGINKKSWKTVKMAATPEVLFNTTEYKRFISDFKDMQVIVGHNRKATKGTINTDNSHPFVEGNIIMVHNGSIDEQSMKTQNDQIEVDSHLLCHNFQEHGYEKTLKEISGAYALVWYDTEKHSLFLARNSQRPLYYIKTSTKVWFASESKMLHWILDRNNTYGGSLAAISVPIDKILEFKIFPKFEEVELENPDKGKVYGGRYTTRHSFTASTKPTTAPAKVGEEVVFVPEKFSVVNQKLNLYRLEGLSCSKDKKDVVVSAAILTWKDGEKALTDYINNAKFKASISSKIYTSNGLRYFVDIIKPLENDKVKLFNKVELDRSIWEDICDPLSNHRCIKCNQKPLSSEVQFTSVNIKSDQYKIVCADCITKLIENGKIKDISVPPLQNDLEWDENHSESFV